jgi:hypothetical protein
MAQAQRKLEVQGDAPTEAHQEELMTHGLNAVWTLGKLEVGPSAFFPFLFFQLDNISIFRSIE